jgi:hypothetical protein
MSVKCYCVIVREHEMKRSCANNFPDKESRIYSIHLSIHSDEAAEKCDFESKVAERKGGRQNLPFAQSLYKNDL